MSGTPLAVVRRVLLLTAGAAALAMAGLTGCSSTGFNTNSLVPPGFARGTRGTMDGFVFVPSRARQAATGIAIPNAIIKVYRIVGGGQPNVLLATTQADADGHYRAEGMPLNSLLLVEAIDPFVIPGQPQRRVTGVISFQVAEDRTRNLNEASTVAASVVENQGNADPLSEQQVSQLETLAEQRLESTGHPDVTGDPGALSEITTDLADESFGELEVEVYSTPVTTASVFLNGDQVGTVATLLPGDEAGTNHLHLSNLAIGQVDLRITAPGFLAEVFTADIVAGQTTDVSRTLVPAPIPGQNQPPVIVDQRTVPDHLGFAGGEVVIQAMVIDADGDDLMVWAEVEPPTIGGQAASRPAWTVPLELTTDHVYSGSLDVPGNPNLANATYSVTIFAHDPTHEATPTQAILSFQVAGVNPPPDVPTRR